MMLPANTRIFVCTEPVDMRRSFDGLACIAKTTLGQDPQSGSLFVFGNKTGNRLKILWFDRNGFCILYKRLHDARFRLPRHHNVKQPPLRIDGSSLAQLLAGVEKTRRT